MRLFLFTAIACCIGFTGVSEGCNDLKNENAFLFA
jgi:hypothetical protein